MIKSCIMNKSHFVYMILTEGNTFYCGYTDNVEKRFIEHYMGKGAKYTKAFKPVRVVYSKEFSTKSEALKEEYRIKHKLTHKQKIKLISSYDESISID